MLGPPVSGRVPMRNDTRGCLRWGVGDLMGLVGGIRGEERSRWGRGGICWRGVVWAPAISWTRSSYARSCLLSQPFTIVLLLRLNSHVLYIFFVGLNSVSCLAELIESLSGIEFKQRITIRVRLNISVACSYTSLFTLGVRYPRKSYWACLAFHE